MHGAGCGEGFADFDGCLLERIRKIVGKKPVTASLDLHGNMTEKMVKMADGLFGIKTNPHVDCYEAGYRAATVLAGMLKNQYRPRMSFRKIPMLVPLCGSSTLEAPAGMIKEYIEEYVRKKHLLDATFFHGFAAADTPHTGASVVVVADGYVPDKEAEELAEYIWQMRERFIRPSLTAKEALEDALTKVRDGYVVVNEGSDNPGAGCPGDGTHLLREMVRRDLPGSIMGPIFDPIAAEVCHKYQVGDRFSLEVGGRTHPAFGDPLFMEEVELLALSDGEFVCASPVNMGTLMHYGPSARLRCGNVELIVVSNRFQTYDDRPFLMTGVDMKNYSIVALKSTNHFKAYFEKVADAIVSTDTPSVFPVDVRKLKYDQLVRPIYPLDEDVILQEVWYEEYNES